MSAGPLHRLPASVSGGVGRGLGVNPALVTGVGVKGHGMGAARDPHCLASREATLGRTCQGQTLCACSVRQSGVVYVSTRVTSTLTPIQEVTCTNIVTYTSGNMPSVTGYWHGHTWVVNTRSYLLIIIHVALFIHHPCRPPPVRNSFEALTDTRRCTR